MELTKQNLKSIQDEVLKALVPAEQKFGVKFAFRGGRFDSTTATVKLEIATVSDGQVNTREMADFLHYAPMFGVKAEDLGRQFTTMGRTYTLVGLNPRGNKYPFICERSDGRQFKFTEKQIVSIFKGAL